MSISRVDGLLAEMRAAMAAAHSGALQATGSSQAAGAAAGTTGSMDFTSALKNALDGVSQAQHKSEDMQKAFVMGDPNVSLSDVMIADEKAGIQFQASIQVRNKVVAAYNDIMNMQV